jgi:uncharacterized protein YjbI with pentapeptide repeats
MAKRAHLQILRQGVDAWNVWRKQHPDKPQLGRADLYGTDLRDLLEANLSRAQLSGANLSWRNLSGANLSRANLSGANLVLANLSEANLSEAILSEAILNNANLSNANLSEANLEANFGNANLSNANLRKANLVQANLSGAILIGTDLREATLNGANLSGANLSGANLAGANLACASLVDADITDADLTGSRIYGVSAWNLKLGSGTRQQDLVITLDNEPEVTVDNIEVAQFIYLMLNNQKVRNIIDTITSKAVLILGRFSKKRKTILDAIRDELRTRDFLPVIFDFSIPASRDVTDTVKVLASLARFVIADITNATEVRAELHNIVPQFTSLPVQMILQRGHRKFVSEPHLEKYPWVLPAFPYETKEHLLANLNQNVVGPAEAKVLEIRDQPR